MSRSSWITLIIAVVLLVVFVTPLFMPVRHIRSLNSCVNLLRNIAGVKEQWAQDKKKNTNDIPTWDDLRIYFKEMPVCPKGGTYTINAVGTEPTCSIGGEHRLP